MRVVGAAGAIGLACVIFTAGAGAAWAGGDYETRELPIIDGRLAGAGDLLATVALVDPETGEAFCTGTLVAPRVVVTAAHCLVEQDEMTGEVLAVFGPEQVVVAAGALDVYDATEGQYYGVARVAVHPDYPNESPQAPHPSGAGRYDDIAALVLDRDVNGVAVATIPTTEQAAAALTAGVELTVSGYGLTDPDGEETGILYLAEVPFVHLAEAEVVLGRAGTPDTCQGDSGGPAYLQSGGALLLIGTTSRGAEDVEENCGGGGIYAFTPSYRSWIASNSNGAYTPGADPIPTDPTDPTDPNEFDDDCDDELYDCDEDEGCASGGGGPPWLALLIVVPLLAARRRRLRG